MPLRLKNGLCRALLAVHILLAILLLCSAFLPRLHPQWFALGALAGIPFLFLVVSMLCFVPVWLLCDKKYYLLSLAALLVCLQPLSVSLGGRLFARSTTPAGNGNSFRLMTFNASSLGLKHYREDTAVQNKVYRTIQQANPDILCLQEFYSGRQYNRTNNLDSICQVMDYPSCFFTADVHRWEQVFLGIALYTRFPILQARAIAVDSTQEGSGHSILEADLLMHGDTVRLYTVQLKSYMFTDKDFAAIRRIRQLQDLTLTSTRHILSRMSHTVIPRAYEADTLHALIARSPYPVVLCGDFNDVPVSYTYNVLSSGMQDAFLAQGWGIGRTYRTMAPTLRIDYILTDPRLYCEAYNTFPHPLFEHTPVMATLHLQKL